MNATMAELSAMMFLGTDQFRQIFLLVAGKIGGQPPNRTEEIASQVSHAAACAGRALRLVKAFAHHVGFGDATRLRLVFDLPDEGIWQPDG